MEQLVDFTDADQIIADTCTGACTLEDFDDLLLTRFEDGLDVKVDAGEITQDDANDARLKVTRQIAYLQDNAGRACATDIEVFDCERACETTLDGQMAALEWVSKKKMGPCNNFNFQFTNKHADIRSAISVPKSVATIDPVFAGQTNCAYADLKDVYDAYVEWSFIEYPYQKGRLLDLAMWNIYDLAKQASEDDLCVSNGDAATATVSCSIMEPSGIDLSDKKAASIAFANLMRDTLNTMNNCRLQRMAKNKIAIFRKRANKF